MWTSRSPAEGHSLLYSPSTQYQFVFRLFHTLQSDLQTVSGLILWCLAESSLIVWNRFWYLFTKWLWAQWRCHGTLEGYTDTMNEEGEGVIRHNKLWNKCVYVGRWIEVHVSIAFLVVLSLNFGHIVLQSCYFVTLGPSLSIFAPGFCGCLLGSHQLWNETVI